MVLVVVLRCSAVSQSRQVGPGGVTRDAATTRRPQSAVYSPWPATSSGSRGLLAEQMITFVGGAGHRRGDIEELPT